MVIPSDDRRDFIEGLRQVLLGNYDLSQNEVARHANIAPGTLSQILSNVSAGRTSTFEKLGRAVREIVHDASRGRGRSESEVALLATIGRLLGTHAERSFRDIDVPLSRDRLRFGIVQLQGPFPDGKHPATGPDGRNSLVWSTAADPSGRCSKALAALDWLHANDPAIELVIFPEYSFPVSPILNRLVEKAAEYDVIIVGGADSLFDENAQAHINMSPVVIPGREPVWIRKHHLYQWEIAYMAPARASNALRFSWNVNGIRYWFLVYTSLDFLKQSITDAAVAQLGGPGVFVVPACSPVIDEFSLVAATQERLSGGTATLLCNCVGQPATGNSGVYCQHTSAPDLRPAIRLSRDSEGIVVGELNLQALGPTDVTPAQSRSALPIQRLLTVDYKQGEILAIERDSHDAGIVVRGVLNPRMFTLSGTTMRVAFLEVHRPGTVSAALKEQHFETMAVLGNADLIVTHLHQSENEMLYDITKSAGLNVKSPGGFGAYSGDEDPVQSLPYFQVERFHKVLGIALDSYAQDIAHVPTPEDLGKIVALAKDWYDPKVEDGFRDACLTRRWILGRTTKRPGELYAVIAVVLENRSTDLERRLRAFEDQILPRIVASDAVTSVFGGTGHRLNLDYLLRVTGGMGELFELVEALQGWAEETRELIATSTFVVAKRLSALSLDRVLSIQALAGEDHAYAKAFLLPALQAEERLRFTALPRREQESLLEHYRRVEQRLANLRRLPVKAKKPGAWDAQRVRRSLASGMLNFFYGSGERDREEAFGELKEVHDFLQLKVEGVLRRSLHEAEPGLLEEAKESARVPAGKDMDEMSYSDKVKTMIAVAKLSDHHSSHLETYQSLYATVGVRNTLAHAKSGEVERAGIGGFSDVLTRYCGFLEDRWQ